MTTVISKPFVSNCAIVAIKEKLKHPTKVRLIILHAKDNFGTPCPHFMWTDGEFDYDFNSEKYISLIKAVTLHKGCVNKHERGWAERLIAYSKKRKAMRVNPHCFFIPAFLFLPLFLHY